MGWTPSALFHAVREYGRLQHDTADYVRDWPLGSARYEKLRGEVVHDGTLALAFLIPAQTALITGQSLAHRWQQGNLSGMGALDDLVPAILIAGACYSVACAVFEAEYTRCRKIRTALFCARRDGIRAERQVIRRRLPRQDSVPDERESWEQ